MSYYDDLGIHPSASTAEVESAYRRLAQKLHPDRNPGKKAQAEAQFKKLQEIYEILRSPETRAKYDEMLKSRDNDRKGTRTSPGTSMAAAPSRREEPHPQSKRTAPPPDEPSDFRHATKSGSVDRIWRHKLFFPIAAGLLLLVAAIATVAKRPPSADAVQATKDAEVASRIALLERQEELRTLEKKEAAHREAVALLRAQLQRVADEGQKVFARIKLLRGEVAEWDTNVATLLTNDKGKYLAADDHHILAFEEILRKPRPTKQDVDAIEQRVRLVLAPIESELKKPEPVLEPSQSINEQLATELATVDKLLEEVRAPKQEAESLLAVAEQSGKASTLTLTQASADLRAKTKREQGEKQAAEARDAKMRKLAAEKAQEELRVANQKLAIEAEAKASMKKAEDEKLHAELVRKAQSSQTRSLLSFFLLPGHLQADLSETAEKRPFSLSKLEARSCLERTPEGQARLLHCLVTTYEKERPIWKDTPYVSDLSPAKREKLEKIQSALIELGPTLVELNMLDP